jgi:hypothetical protein
VPEQISKYPDITIQVLREGGAQCGSGVEKKILKACPSERFCAFPSGEICVFGLNQVEQMTQIKPQELAQAVCPQARPAHVGGGGFFPEASALGVTFALGIAVGAISIKLRKRET